LGRTSRTRGRRWRSTASPGGTGPAGRRRGPGLGRSWHGLHAQVEEMRGTADARVVAPDELLDPEGRLVYGQVEDARRERGQVGLDGGLVLARRRHDLGVADQALLVELVGMEDE